MDTHQGSRLNNTVRSFNGCYTCRLRRKKCDERQPICETCATLHITCHYHHEKPDWMDGGAKQEEMAEQLRREVRENAHLRRAKQTFNPSPSQVSTTKTTPATSSLQLENRPKCLPSPICAVSMAADTLRNGNGSRLEASEISPQREVDRTLLGEDARENISLETSDTVLLMLYLDHLLPFQFPFYQPSVLEGGKAWILEMLIRSPVIRKTAFCQSSYFFSLAQRAANSDGLWDAVLVQTEEAFGMLRDALQVLEGAGIEGHLHGAVRILASIMQVQRFEITVSSFDNCYSHLNAALVLFRQILDSANPVEQAGGLASFNAVLSRLGPVSPISSSKNIEIPSAEHAAFRFSSTLLVLDDIVASTVLQEEPKLFSLHRCLLGHDGNISPVINLEVVIGCQNWVLLGIGQIAALDAWKQQCTRVGNLNVMELVQRAMTVKASLDVQLAQVENIPDVSTQTEVFLNVFIQENGHASSGSKRQSSLVTRVWAHAALIYLFVVVSGWQPANADIRYHVGQIIELLAHQITPSALLRTMVWPFCVAGCLAEQHQEDLLRSMVDALQPACFFATARKALEIMENVWRHRNTGDAATCDLAMCFRSQGDHLVLLV